jgi:transcription elongation GreA/GreB family factor
MLRAMAVDKQALREELVGRLEKERDTLIAAQKATSAGVTHDEAKADSDKDTRKTEASYLARGQAKRAQELSADAEKARAMTLRKFTPTDPITISAVVEIADANGKRSATLFVAPAGGGMSLGGDAFRVITPRSPLGRALVGAREGDFVEVERAGVTEEIEVLSVM